jgi:hypothetical protein
MFAYAESSSSELPRLLQRAAMTDYQTASREIVETSDVQEKCLRRDDASNIQAQRAH